MIPKLPARRYSPGTRRFPSAAEAAGYADATQCSAGSAFQAEPACERYLSKEPREVSAQQGVSSTHQLFELGPPSPPSGPPSGTPGPSPAAPAEPAMPAVPP